MSKSGLQSFVVRYAANEAVYGEGDLGTTMYIVQVGKVRLFHTLDSQKRELGVMEKGDFFGEMSILEGLPRSSGAEALEDTELIEINSNTFDKMIRGNIEIAVRLLRKLSLRLRETERKLSEYQSLAPNGAAEIASAPAPARHDEKRADSGVRLVTEEGDQVYSIGEGETLLGRYDPVTEQRPDVDLSDLDLKRSVSRRHARLLLDDGVWSVVEEIGALNGTFVNGEKLVTGQPHPLNDGDELSIGMVKMRFRT
jgi:CRP-like cAMP-binding protein